MLFPFKHSANYEKHPHGVYVGAADFHLCLQMSKAQAGKQQLPTASPPLPPGSHCREGPLRNSWGKPGAHRLSLGKVMSRVRRRALYSTVIPEYIGTFTPLSCYVQLLFPAIDTAGGEWGKLLKDTDLFFIWDGATKGCLPTQAISQLSSRILPFFPSYSRWLCQALWGREKPPASSWLAVGGPPCQSHLCPAAHGVGCPPGAVFHRGTGRLSKGHHSHHTQTSFKRRRKLPTDSLRASLVSW